MYESAVFRQSDVIATYQDRTFCVASGFSEFLTIHPLATMG
jgi:hypothetical protein